MKSHLYLVELFIAMICVGAATLLLHRAFDVMVLKSFFVAFVAMGIGLGFFWIYFVPRAQEKHQRTLGFVTSLVVGMGLAPWVVEPITAPLFVDRAESFELFLRMDENIIYARRDIWDRPPALSHDEYAALGKKLEKDGFSSKRHGSVTWYSRRSVTIQLVEVFQGGESRGFEARIGWRAQGLWFQAQEIEAEGDAYIDEVEAWDKEFRNSRLLKK